MGVDELEADGRERARDFAARGPTVGDEAPDRLAHRGALGLVDALAVQRASGSFVVNIHRRRGV